MLKNSKYWLAFASLEKTGSTFVNKLYDFFNYDIERAWNADISDLVNVENITKKQIEAFLTEKKNVEPDKCTDYILKSNIDFITFDSPNYPELLRHIYNPPMTLFVAGDLNRCNLNKTLAIVGSRKASDYSKDILNRIVNGFFGSDICIVSGLATGIDTAAHYAAINSNLSTIAVIAGGFKNIYPTSNKSLFREIQNSHGAVISEYWPTCEPIAWRFPHRNRIVSGLSQGTLVAEAALKSGALITAKLCLEQGRELMCIPGLVSNPNTEGIYKLLKDGATLVTGPNDVLEALGWEFKQDNTKRVKENNSHLSAPENIVYDIISKDSVNIDDLILKTNMNIGDLMVILTKLEIDGLIKQTDGDKYISHAVF